MAKQEVFMEVHSVLTIGRTAVNSTTIDTHLQNVVCHTATLLRSGALYNTP